VGNKDYFIPAVVGTITRRVGEPGGGGGWESKVATMIILFQERKGPCCVPKLNALKCLKC
jgi:hypothetical protein